MLVWIYERDRSGPDALEILRPIAWRMHVDNRTYDLSAAEMRAVGPVVRKLESRRGKLPLSGRRWRA